MKEDAYQLLEPASFMSFMGKRQRSLVAFHALRTLSVIAVVPFPLITQYLVDNSIPNRDIPEILVLCAWGSILIALHYGAMIIAVRILSQKIQDLMVALRSRIFRKLQFMHFGFLDRTQTGRLLSKYAFDTQNIEGGLIPILNSIIPEIIRASLLIATLIWISPWNAVFIAATLPVFAYVRIRFAKRIAATNHAARLARERLTGKANEYISAIKLVRGYGQGEQAEGALEGVSDAYADTRRAQMQVNQGMNTVVFSMNSAINLLAVCFGAALVVRESISIGALIALVGALPVILTPINIYAQFNAQYLLAAESYQSIKELVDSNYVEQWRGKKAPRSFSGRIQFDDVSFAYTDGSDNVISGIDLEIRAQENIAFVGTSGSGKSTLVNLMLGLYAPNSGAIYIDGFAQQELDMQHLRKSCAIVMQDSILLSGTILDNIRFGRPEARKSEAVAASKMANAWEFISKLPEGIETRVGERGASLSGGQRQRIAIARAILRDPAILILDEATSALDNQSERLVRDALASLSRGRTTITIAHRLSSIRKADRILVMESGQIVEQGTFEELSARPETSFEKLRKAAES